MKTCKFVPHDTTSDCNPLSHNRYCVQINENIKIHNADNKYLGILKANSPGEGVCLSELDISSNNPFTGHKYIIKHGNQYTTAVRCKYPGVVGQESIFKKCDILTGCRPTHKLVYDGRVYASGDAIDFDPALAKCVCPPNQVHAEGPFCKVATVGDAERVPCYPYSQNAKGECECPPGFISSNDSRLLEKGFYSEIDYAPFCVKVPCKWDEEDFEQSNEWDNNAKKCVCDHEKGWIGAVIKEDEVKTILPNTCIHFFDGGGDLEGIYTEYFKPSGAATTSLKVERTKIRKKYLKIIGGKRSIDDSRETPSLGDVVVYVELVGSSLIRDDLKSGLLQERPLSAHELLKEKPWLDLTPDIIASYDKQSTPFHYKRAKTLRYRTKTHDAVPCSVAAPNFIINRPHKYRPFSTDYFCEAYSAHVMKKSTFEGDSYTYCPVVYWVKSPGEKVEFFYPREFAIDCGTAITF